MSKINHCTIDTEKARLLKEDVVSRRFQLSYSSLALVVIGSVSFLPVVKGSGDQL